jgi:hypothetical protein
VCVAGHEFGFGKEKITENPNKLHFLPELALGFTKTYNMGETYQSSRERFPKKKHANSNSSKI